MDSAGGASDGGPIDPSSNPDRLPIDPRLILDRPLIDPRSIPDRPAINSRSTPIDFQLTPDRPPIDPRRYPFWSGYPYGPAIRTNELVILSHDTGEETGTTGRMLACELLKQFLANGLPEDDQRTSTKSRDWNQVSQMGGGE